MHVIRMKSGVHADRHGGVVAFAHAHVHRLALSALAVSSAATAVLVSRRVFPFYSLNRDEPVYVDMAHLIERGRVTLPLSRSPFRPWASGVASNHIVMKYTPPWPSVIAIGDVLTGSTRAALAANAAFVLVAVYWLARTVTADRATAVVAAALVASSPLFIVQSGTYLPYLFTIGLCCASAAATLSAADTTEAPARRWRLAAAGLLGGLAVFARSFDAVLMLAPVLGVTVAAMWRQHAAAAWRFARDWSAGAFVPIAGMLVFNWRILGSPTSMPFSVTGSSDTFGFGRRGIFEASTLKFDLADGISGMFTNLQWMFSWVAGGAVLIALAAVGGWRAARSPGNRGARALLMWVAIFPLAYVAFWGPWAMSHNWEGVESLGPFYHLPILIPIAIFGARMLVSLARSRQRLLVVTVVAMVALTLIALPDKQRINSRATAEYRAAATAIEESSLDNAILFLPYRGESGFLDLVPFLHNRPDLDQPVLYAEDRGAEANRQLLTHFAGRQGFVLERSPAVMTGHAGTYRVRQVEASGGNS